MQTARIGISRFSDLSDSWGIWNYKFSVENKISTVKLYPPYEVSLWVYSGERKLDVEAQKNILSDFAKKNNFQFVPYKDPWVSYKDPFAKSTSEYVARLHVLVPKTMIQSSIEKEDIGGGGTITRVTKDRIDFGGYKDSALTAVHIYGNPDAGSTETKTEYF
jgi:hypothetical protein